MGADKACISPQATLSLKEILITQSIVKHFVPIEYSKYAKMEIHED